MSENKTLVEKAPVGQNDGEPNSEQWDPPLFHLKTLLANVVVEYGGAGIVIFDDKGKCFVLKPEDVDNDCLLNEALKDGAYSCWSVVSKEELEKVEGDLKSGIAVLQIRDWLRGQKDPRWKALSEEEKEAELQPFPAVMELVDEYGAAEVLMALANTVELDVEDDEEPGEVCNCCMAKNKRLSLELRQLVERMADFEDSFEVVGEAHERTK